MQAGETFLNSKLLQVHACMQTNIRSSASVQERVCSTELNSRRNVNPCYSLSSTQHVILTKTQSFPSHIPSISFTLWLMLRIPAKHLTLCNTINNVHDNRKRAAANSPERYCKTPRNSEPEPTLMSIWYNNQLFRYEIPSVVLKNTPHKRNIKTCFNDNIFWPLLQWFVPTSYYFKYLKE